MAAHPKESWTLTIAAPHSDHCTIVTDDRVHGISVAIATMIGGSENLVLATSLVKSHNACVEAHIKDPAAIPEAVEALTWASRSIHHPACRKTRRTSVNCNCAVGAAEKALTALNGRR